MELRANDEIGPYRIVRALGQGGMGAVYEVEHIKLGVHYALKTFTLDHGHVDLFRKRFLAEGKVLARLSHPNIARVFDLDIVEGDELAFFVMDLVHYKDGESYTLADIEVGGADEEHLVRWFAQLASAIDYIHGVGIVHRDIKLNNILLNDKGGVTLSDFGISKFEGERIRSEVNVSRTMVSMADGTVTGNLVMGTEGYMAPEILRGRDASAASDTYALGVTFFRLLTGMWYEPGTNALKLLEPFDSAWMEILPRMLEADPKKRPVNLTVLANKLKSSVTTNSLSTIRTKIVNRPDCPRPCGQTLAGLIRHPWPWVGLGAAAALAIAAGVWFLSGRSGDDGTSLYDHLYDIPECLG